MESVGGKLLPSPFPLARVKGGEGWVKGRRSPFTPPNALFMGISGRKVKGEGFFLIPLFASRFTVFLVPLRFRIHLQR